VAKSIGLRVTVVILSTLRQETRSDEIAYQNKNLITVHEILRHFAINKPQGNNKIWIKRADPGTFRETPYEMGSQLPWESFNNCTMVLAPTLAKAMAALNPQAKTAIDSDAAYQKKLEEQVELWREKKELKEKRGQRLPRSIELKRQKLLVIRKRKRKARIEILKKENENKEKPPAS